ncbi:hypothetical protein GCM10020367_05600 [Streptomyces sannanensis]|uniref:SMI1/KNR4 family protein n=1 Tax=Streptomyces sannanensis TaxID=285536 RepID=A0ABP6S4T8_9ACTN
MEVFQLHELLGPPRVNGDVGADWESVEARSGVIFPGDYKEFISAYGPGCVNDQLYFFHPRAGEGPESLGLESLWEQAAYAYGELSRSYPELYPHSLYPAKDGVIPVARSTSGNYVFLVPPERESREWRVAVDVGQWVVLELQFVDFLWSALRGELFVPIIEGDPSFEQVGFVEPY